MSGTVGSYQQRALTFTVSLGTGAVGAGKPNTFKLAGLRGTASIKKGGMPSMDSCVARVYGVVPAVMNACSTLGIPLPMTRLGNTLKVEAGNVGGGMSVVFYGALQNCWQDYSEAPDVAMSMTAFGSVAEAIQPVAPVSYRGAADVATMLAGIAQSKGWVFENNGVAAVLSNPYYPGTALQQVEAIARDAGIVAYVDTNSDPNVLAAWPRDGYRTKLPQLPLIAASTGMIGYPQFQSNGMSFRTLFNPSIRLNGAVIMQSSVGVAPTAAPNAAPVPPGTQSGGPNGKWMVIGPLTHDLSAQIANGPWFTDAACSRIPGPSS